MFPIVEALLSEPTKYKNQQARKLLAMPEVKKATFYIKTVFTRSVYLSDWVSQSFKLRIINYLTSILKMQVTN